MAAAGLGWRLEVIHTIPSACKVMDPALRQFFERYYDPILDDDHKGRAVFGFRDVGLPLVLSHNTPNDSVAILWADTTRREGGRGMHALFPRYERHHADRP